MWILMRMIPMRMVMHMGREKFFYDIEKEKSPQKNKNRILTSLERFGEDMDDSECEHRSRTECEEGIQKRGRNISEAIEHHSRKSDDE